MDVLHCFGTTDPLFDVIQEIRRDGAEQTVYGYDEYSHHYLLNWQGQPLGALTVQAAANGRLDCEDHYPAVLLEQHCDELIATCKLRIRRGPSTPIQALRTLVRRAWEDQLSRGKRISIVNADVRMQAFYRRIGFTYLPGFDFVHPDLQTPSNVLLMAVDASQRSYCQDLFDGIPNQVDQQPLVEMCCGSFAQTGAVAKVGSLRLAAVA
ncbi:hypothetical protein RISK_006258 [Rhodopirellula islandica]|uniref:N-acetyltransferase domain-containing protein n=1 Tax=Rhodopirellula islandica TaxID=595434 RepID=A0A0J1E8H3_RHOIS|nr:hypothetical protein [Rhodopirellula islandica]KLU01759.1 hypothetical protein RISK_006258 [Rhodopirellula islandica]